MSCTTEPPRLSKPNFQPFDMIPREVLVAVSDRLPSYASIALSLTCKSLYSLLFRPGKLSRCDSELLGLVFERDLPGRYFCHGCCRLRLLDPRSEDEWKEAQQPHDGWIQPLEHNCRGLYIESQYPQSHSFRWAVSIHKQDRYIHEPRWVYCVGLPAVGFTVAHLVMSRHLYGAKHGIPIAALENRSVTIQANPYSPNTIKNRDSRAEDSRPSSFQVGVNIKVKHNDKAKIINNELFMARSLRQSRLPAESIASALGHERYSICAHVDARLVVFQMWLDTRQPCSIEALFLEIVSTGLEGFEPFDLERPIVQRGSCRSCLTDYTLSLTRNDETKEFALDLQTFHCLGSCRTPWEPTWRLLCTMGHSDTRRTGGVWDKGEVQKRWLNSGGAEADTGFQWSLWYPQALSGDMMFGEDRRNLYVNLLSHYASVRALGPSRAEV